jgi:acyl transferase domain-containing protein/acyl-CoA synthetase (AMP-forming)/AMP-acid ligase II/acyl carrier protein
MSTTPPTPETLAHALQAHAALQPDKVALRFIAPGGDSLESSEIATLTFAELEQQAALVAANLADHAEPGDRALLLCPPGLDYVAALFACFRSGLIAVPAFPPTGTGADSRLTGIIESCEPRLVLSTAELAPMCEAAVLGDAAPSMEMQFLLVDDLEPRPIADVPVSPAGLAFLQYTSGSTDEPRGVMLTHANVLANIRTIDAYLGPTGARAVFWLPPYHDMGLIGGILQPVVLGTETTLMSPLSFLANPLLWLEAFTQYRGTSSAAPNFAYDLCVRRIAKRDLGRLDLSSWETAVNGAEPVQHSTIDRFAEHFAAAGFRRSTFRPSYGLAEATLLVTGPPLGQEPKATRLEPDPTGEASAPPGRESGTYVSAGVPPIEGTLIIVNPSTRTLCREGEVGEIWFQSQSVACGYWNDAAASNATFIGILAEDPAQGAFLRTGDLGALQGGELYVTGRLKDLIIRHGANHYPTDIERTACAADARLRPGCLAAFEAAGHEAQEVVLVAEASAALEGEDSAEIWRNVRQRVADEQGITLDELVLIIRGTSLKTSSGKIRRRATRAAYLRNELAVLATHRLSAVSGDAQESLNEAQRFALQWGSVGRAGDRTSADRDTTMADALAAAHSAQREGVIVDLVLGAVAGLLGQPSIKGMDPSRTFKELGVDSVRALELRDRLTDLTGHDLSPTLVFDHPTPAAAAEHLLQEWERGSAAAITDGQAPAADDVIAVVGMSCRFPGGINSPDDLWRLVASGTDAIGEFPTDRGWPLGRLYHSDAGHAGTSYTSHGGFMQDADRFDAEFFSIGEQEALATDPQQRLLLEGTWEACENAGIDPAQLRGSRTGVFVGIVSSQYGIGGHNAMDVEGYMATGTTPSLASGRIAYTFDLKGPALSIDTACSSSLVAIHEACQALRAGTCLLAVAGGVSVLSTPELFIAFSRQRGLSPDGRCKAFADAADGTGWGEGVGVVLLERLADAKRNGHRILGLIAGSAVNHDGATNGLTAPSRTSQEQVIADALRSADLQPHEIDTVEAHGTGTPLGDPIEARALIKSYGRSPRQRPLLVGSVKSNMGHTQAAGGVAGLIKMLMAFREKLLPMTLHVDQPSRHVNWSSGPVALLTEAQPWARRENPRRAAISSFGLSGTNAHLILEEPPQPLTLPPAGDGGAPDGPLPFVVTAKSAVALRTHADQLQAHLHAHPEDELGSVAWTLAGRHAHNHRAAIVTDDRPALLATLQALADGRTADGLIQGTAVPRAKVAFVFPGQGCQWQGMAAEMQRTSPVFASSMQVCLEALAPHLAFSLEDLLYGGGDASSLERVDAVQPALFAIMVSLAALWRSFGVEPAAVIGHSQGEIAAAYVAGALTLADAARVVATRSTALAEKLAGRGGMAAISLPAKQVKQRITSFAKRLALAAENGPASTVVSGEVQALDELIALCESDGIRARRIAVDYASHSSQVEAIRGRLKADMSTIAPRSAAIPFFSSTTGGLLDTSGLGPDYWYRNLRQRVRFHQATRSLIDDAGITTFIEISPHPVLTMAVEETAESQSDEPEGVAAIGTLRREQGGMERYLSSLAQADVRGVPVQWRALWPERVAHVDLPTYAFQRRRFWLLPSSEHGSHDDHAHVFLDAKVPLAEQDGWLFTGRVSLERHGWIADHVVLGQVLLPSTALIDLLLTAGGDLGCDTVEELTLESPLLPPAQGEVALQLTIHKADESGRRSFAIHFRGADNAADAHTGESEWIQAGSGSLTDEGDAPKEARRRSLKPWSAEGAEDLDVNDLCERVARVGGVDYGPAFQGLHKAWVRDGEVLSEVALGQDYIRDASRYLLHPALLDLALRAATALLIDDDGDDTGRVIFCWEGAQLYAPGVTALKVRATSRRPGAVALDLFDDDGEPVMSVHGVVARAITGAQMQAARGADEGSLLHLEWSESAQTSAIEPPPSIAVLSGAGEHEAQLIPGAATHVDLETLVKAIGSDAQPPDIVLAPLTHDADTTRSVAAAHAATARALNLVQSWLSHDRLADSQLVLLTHRGVAVGEDDDPDLAAAPVWGLVRSIQAEHPDRITLIDTDGSERSQQQLKAALSAPEPQVTLRDGKLRVPRLTPTPPLSIPPQGEWFDRQGTILITGGTGGLGALVARHLVKVHGARHLMLVSRSGEQADGAETLRSDLTALGCDLQISACDVTNRADLEQSLARIPGEHRLTVVIHAAGILDDCGVTSLDEQRLADVMRPKVDAAINLHELTRNMPLSHFILYSSAAGALGSPGQANYAAANAFLDGLAAHRRANGLAAVSLAWGRWEKETGMTVGLSDQDRARSQRLGVAALSDERGLELFDLACAIDRPVLFPIHLDAAALRKRAHAGWLPAIMRGLIQTPRRTSDDVKGTFATKLQDIPESDRDNAILDLVLGQTASLLGYASAEAIDPLLRFTDIGVDSLQAVDLRDRLRQATGARLTSTIAFDYPTPDAMAKHLRERMAGTASGAKARPRAPKRTDEPIAIVGMSCRFPGGVGSPEDLWELVSSARDAIGAFPTDRGWDLGRLVDEDRERAGTTYTDQGGFLYDAADFDPGFFSISPREARAMDPQQRLFLEGVWEALESAGIDPWSLRGSLTGVFAGAGFASYDCRAAGELETFWLTATTASSISGRPAYTFGLQGPSMTLDTACSSSLVAIDAATRALRDDECELALAGGVTVMLQPDMYIYFARQRGLAVDGRCKSFAAAADGAAFSEGMGVLVLERLSRARANGHEVLALVRGAAVNQDGASNGFTAPNGPAQQKVIMRALANAGVSAAEVDVVEGHGTGTTLGDPMEAQALLATYGQDRRGGPLLLGSVKSNIGHPVAAAGVAGVIKTVMSMRHGLVAPTLHVDAPTPHVDWDAGAVKLATELQPWPESEHPRRAGVSSFGVSGTNSHLILEEAPQDPAADPSSSDAQPVTSGALPFLISGASEKALAAQAASLSDYLRARPEIEPYELAGALALRRAHQSHRAAAIASGREELMSLLEALARGEQADGLLRGQRDGAGKVAFLFTGQGAQSPGMGQELYDSFPVFARSLDEICGELDPHLPRPLKEILFATEGSQDAVLLDQTQFTQAALFALEVALYRLTTAFGIVPDYLIGHSIGELAAAHVASVLSLPDACTLVAARGRLMGALPEGGAMLSVRASEQEVLASLDGFEQQLAIAAINAPNAVVISGDSDAIEHLDQHWQQQGRKTTRLRVSHAFHSQRMDAMLEEFKHIARGLTFNPPTIPIVSNLTGEFASDQLTTPGYWARHVRDAVRFMDGIHTLEQAGVTRYLELGPSALLCSAARQCLTETTEQHALLASTLNGDKPQHPAFITFLAQTHLHRAPVDWQSLFTHSRAPWIPLPPYAFQRERLRFDPATAEGDLTAAGLSAAHHPLLGATVRVAGGDERLSTGRLSPATQPWLEDHVVLDTVVVPGTTLVELALTAGSAAGCDTLEELTLEAPLILADHVPAQMQVRIGEPDDQARRSIVVYSRPEISSASLEEEAEWIRYASGTLSSTDGTALEPPSELAWPPADAEPVDVEKLYERFAEIGFFYGAVFQGVRAAWRRGDDIFAEVSLDQQHAAEAGRFGIHPALFDAALHPGLNWLETSKGSATIGLPYSWTGVRLGRVGASRLRVRVRPAGEGAVSMKATDDAGVPVIAIDALRFLPVDADQLSSGQATQDSLFTIDWFEVLRGPGAGEQRQMAIIGDLGETNIAVPGFPTMAALAEAIAAGAPAPDVVLVEARDDRTGNGHTAIETSAHNTLRRTLGLIQSWLADEQFADSQLVVVTHQAVGVLVDDTPDLTAAPVWGLLRSAQAEHPGRFRLVDLDTTDGVDWQVLLSSIESQVAVRNGRAYFPRLVRASLPQPISSPTAAAEGTTLITGGTAGLGALVARHLAATGQARRLLLVSRRGAQAEGADELVTELARFECTVTVTACDTGDRDQMAAVVDAIPPEHPLTTVIHAAGVRDDGVIESLSDEQMARVLRPKVDGAWHLHQLTEHMDLSRFVLFSSAAATLGSAGQGNYAAANAFLDALAQHRHAQSLPASSLAWGLWSETGGMSGGLDAAAVSRIKRMGIDGLSNEQGLDLLQSAFSVDEPRLIPVQLNGSVLRVAARAGRLPALLSSVVRAPRSSRQSDAGSLARRLQGVPQGERAAVVLDVVRAHAATALGHPSLEAVAPDRTFDELGVDSLRALEIREGLAEVSGLRLPATLAFDFPTPAAVAEFMVTELERVSRPPIDALLDSIERSLGSILADENVRARVESRLLPLLMPTRPLRPDAITRAAIESASADEVLGMIDEPDGARSR